MCSHYQAVRNAERLRGHFRLDALPPEGGKVDVWPGYLAPFIRRHEFADVGDEAVAEREPLVGSFGLIPHWATDTKIARHTYNARTIITWNGRYLASGAASEAVSRRRPRR